MQEEYHLFNLLIYSSAPFIHQSMYLTLYQALKDSVGGNFTGQGMVLGDLGQGPDLDNWNEDKNSPEALSLCVSGPSWLRHQTSSSLSEEEEEIK